MGEKLKKTRWSSCNVLKVGVEARHIWQFDARNGGFPALSLSVEPATVCRVAFTNT